MNDLRATPEDTMRTELEAEENTKRLRIAQLKTEKSKWVSNPNRNDPQKKKDIEDRINDIDDDIERLETGS